MHASEDVLINLIRPAAHQALGERTPARETQDSRDDGFDSLFSQSNFEKLGREFCASNTIAGLGERENKQPGQIVRPERNPHIGCLGRVAPVGTAGL